MMCGWERQILQMAKLCDNIFNQPNLNCRMSSQYPRCSQEPLPSMFHLPDKKRAERIRLSRFLSRSSWCTFVNHKRFFSSDNVWHQSLGFAKKNLAVCEPVFQPLTDRRSQKDPKFLIFQGNLWDLHQRVLCLPHRESPIW